VSLGTNGAETGEGLESRPPDSVPVSIPPERATPERIGRYELRFELASGSMGSVYLARLDRTAGFERPVALKRIHPHLAEETDCIEMFLNEAEIASRIVHPNVCSVFDFGQADGEYYIAMEYLVAEPLARVYTRVAKVPEQRRSPLLPLRMARIIADACEGLHAAHELKDTNGDPLHVVHRDVAPKNLLVTYNGAVQLLDFGLASARQRVHGTSLGDVKGTIAYMAPEQLKAGTIDRRIDTWALGVALWEALAVKRLFRRDTTADTMFALLYEEIAPPSKFRPQVPNELDEIALKALARDPNERWQTARAMGRALREFLGKQDELIGPAELSDWMAELFPQGEARKNQLMELARMPHAPVLSIPSVDEFDAAQAATLAETIPIPRKSERSRSAMIVAVAALMAIGGAIAVALGAGDAGEYVEPAPAAVAEASPEKAALPEGPIPAAKPGTVNLVTRGGWAEVFKDGKSLGSTPRRLTLPAGRHKLVLKPSGDGPAKRVFVDVEADTIKQVSIRLD